ncbi:MAG: bifunctional phosphoribosyl-AMP cyclohydrolase/phosphoribosyl-ATP diphosphatase HisIE [Lachnospiraceae bacterium]|nr:bifunctional phosphoribosyl-AMP cyclohydrolase/phosphoribosyl-ATP diphosphatase HisIE [Lachnospiraceae bacterium]
MNYKSFIASIYLENGKAIKNFNDKTIISTDPIELAVAYAENDVDGILIFDLSYNDTTHEEAIGIIKRIAERVQIPIYGAGNIKRMEDVKKLLYAGCKKAVLNFGKEEGMEILEEVSLKFGKDKIAASIASADNITINKESLEKYANELVLIDEHALKNCLGASALPMITLLPDTSLDRMLTILEQENISAVSGNIVNENTKEIHAIKQICKEKGIKIHTFEAVMDFSDFKLDSNGLLPVVVQDYKTNQVLMVAYMNEEAYLKTLKTGKMTYYSRSRKELWVKGLTSGHFQYVKGLSVDCDNDTLLAKVAQVGAACHTGNYSCFYRDLIPCTENEKNPLEVFESVMSTILDRKVNPKEGSYTNYLFDKGIDKILKKLGEEATEIVIASKNPNPDEIKYEISDFLYHMMVLMAEKGVTWEEITSELAHR